MGERIIGRVVDVGNFDWGRGAVVQDEAGESRFVHASQGMTKAIASRLYQGVEIYGERAEDNRFVAFTLVE